MERAVIILGIVGVLAIWGTDIFVAIWQFTASFF